MIMYSKLVAFAVIAATLSSANATHAGALRGAFNAASGARVHVTAPRIAAPRAAPVRAPVTTAPTTSGSSIGSATSGYSPGHAATHGQGSFARTWGSAATDAVAAKRAAAPTQGSLMSAFKNGSQAENRMHITYLGIDRRTGQPYVGYASKAGASSADEVLRYRYGSGFARFGEKAPHVITHGYGAQGKARTRGTEQLVYERYQGRAIGAANRQNPVGRNNKRAEVYRRQGGEVMDGIRRQ